MKFRIKENLLYWTKKIIFSRDLWTVSVATLCLWLVISSWATMFVSPEVTSRVFQKNLLMALLSFGTSWILVRGIISIIFRYLNKNLNLPLWLIIIPFGCAVFAWYGLTLIGKNSFESFTQGFPVILSIAFVPALIFRIMINFVDSYLQNKKGYSITI